MRHRVPLTFGAGIDRATGRTATPPSSFQDLRNVYLEDARLRLRLGIGGTGFPALSAGTDVCAIGFLEATLDILFVLFERSTRAVTVVRLNPLASPTLQNVGTWGTLNASATLPPVVQIAESYGKLFLAHSEPVYSYRLATQVYTPNATDATVGAMAALTADLNGDSTPGDVKFCGVYAYNDSLWGYGYGEETSATTADRREIVRVSNPANPTTFRPEAYFIAGTPQTHVTGLAALPQVGLIVGKTKECHIIVGTDAETYGIGLLDPNHGNQSHRGMVSTPGAVWMWGLHGARATTGGPTVDMDATLALDTPAPSSLTSPGPVEHMFGFYDMATDTVEFVWPAWLAGTTPTLSYVASVRDPTNIRWSYHTRQACVGCAAWVMLGKESPPALSAYADFTAQADAGIDSGNAAARSVTLTWDNEGTYLGNEQWELWGKPAGGSWSLMTTFAHNGASSQSATVGGFQALQDYDVALRATRSGSYTTGYTGATPDDWAAGTAADSKATVQTSCGTPTMVSAEWRRLSSTSERVQVVFTLADTEAPFLLQTSPDNSTWTTVATHTGPYPRTLNYYAGSGEGETTMYFRVRPARGSILGTAATGLSIYVGPSLTTYGFAIRTAAWLQASSEIALVLQWNGSGTTPGSTFTTDVEVQFAADGSSWSGITKPAGLDGSSIRPGWILSQAFSTGATRYIRWRSAVSYGVGSDYTTWQQTTWNGSGPVNSHNVTWHADPPGGSSYDDQKALTHVGSASSGETHLIFNDGRPVLIQIRTTSSDSLVCDPSLVNDNGSFLSPLGGTWAVPTTTFRYFRVETNGAATSTSKTYPTDPAGIA